MVSSTGVRRHAKFSKWFFLTYVNYAINARVQQCKNFSERLLRETCSNLILLHRGDQIGTSTEVGFKGPSDKNMNWNLLKTHLKPMK